MMQPRQYFQC